MSGTPIVFRVKPNATGLRRLRALAILGLFGVVSCGDRSDPVSPASEAVATVSVTPDSLVVIPAQTVQLSASVVGESGNILTDRAVAWQTTDPSVAVISSDGILVGAGEGTTLTIASVDGVADTATVSVVAADVEESVLVVDEASMPLLSDSTAMEEGTLIFATPTDPDAVPEPGQVLVGTQGDGYLRSVREAAVRGDSLFVETDAAALTDAVRAGALTARTNLLTGASLTADAHPAMEVIQRDVDLAPGVALMQSGISLSGVGFDLGESCESEDACLTGWIGIENGFIGLDLGADLSLRIEEGRVQRFSYVNSGELSLDLAIAAELDGKLSSKALATTETVLGRVSHLHVVMIGWVPVVIRTSVQLVAGFEVSAQANLRAAAEVSARYEVAAGFEYQGGEWTPVLSEAETLSVGDPVWEGRADAGVKVFVRPDIEVELYGVIGPNMGVEGFLAASGSVDTQGWESRGTAGLDLNLGMRARVLDWALIEYSATIPLAEYEIWAVSGSFVRLALDPSEARVPAGGDLQLSVSAADAWGNAQTPPDELHWESSDTAVAEVDQMGRVSANAVGTARILVDAPDVDPAEAIIEVVDPQDVTARLFVEVTGLPDSAEPSLELSGPEGFSTEFSRSTLFEELSPGNYLLTAEPLSVVGRRHDPSPEELSISLVEGDSTAATVEYVPAPTTLGSLGVNVLGLPFGVEGAVVVTGPQGFERFITESAVFGSIPEGTYEIEASPVSGSDAQFEPDLAHQIAEVLPDSQVIVDVAYSEVGSEVPNEGQSALVVEIFGVPDGAADVRVTGPGDFSRAVDRTTTLAELEPGEYQISAEEVVVEDARRYPVPPDQSVTLEAESTDSVAVWYSLTDAEEDADEPEEQSELELFISPVEALIVRPGDFVEYQAAVVGADEGVDEATVTLLNGITGAEVSVTTGPNGTATVPLAVSTGTEPGEYTMRFEASASAFAPSPEVTRALHVETAAPPLVATGEPSQITETSFRMSGSINPSGLPTTWWFEWGTTSSLGQSTPTGSIDGGTQTHAVVHTLSGLTPGQTYHYRIAAENDDGLEVGPTLSVTLPGGSEIVTEPGSLELMGVAEYGSVYRGIHVSIPGVSEFEWRAIPTDAEETERRWLTVDSGTGTQNDSVLVRANSTFLPAGTYEEAILITSQAAPGDTAVVPVAFEVREGLHDPTILWELTDLRWVGTDLHDTSTNDREIQWTIRHVGTRNLPMDQSMDDTYISEIFWSPDPWLDLDGYNHFTTLDYVNWDRSVSVGQSVTLHDYAELPSWVWDAGTAYLFVITATNDQLWRDMADDTIHPEMPNVEMLTLEFP